LQALDDRRLVGRVLVLFVFDLVIIVVVGMSRWRRGDRDGENAVSACGVADRLPRVTAACA
jgi:hypothetical protein